MQVKGRGEKMKLAMKLTIREKIMLAILGFAVVIAAEVYFLFMPQLDKIKALKQEQIKTIIEVQRVRSEIALLDKLQKDCDALFIKVNENTTRFYPEILQDKIIVILDDLFKTSELKANSTSFAVTAIAPLEATKADALKSFLFKELVDQYKKLVGESITSKADNAAETKTEIPAGIDSVESMAVTAQYTGSYERLVQFIKSLEALNRNIVITGLTMQADNDGALTGSLQMIFYALPKINEQDKEYYHWPYVNEYGKTNPF
jgi:type IV pilus assembly protein PilO